MRYDRILLALDFSDSGLSAARRARDLARKYRASLHVLHVAEYLPPVDSTFGAVSPFEVDMTAQMIEAGRKRLRHYAEEWGIPENQGRVEVGSPKIEIIRVAEEIGADLIVVGSHGRHGLGLLLGSTAASVIHHAKCDVLAVRLS